MVLPHMRAAAAGLFNPNIPYWQTVKNLLGSALLQYLPGWDTAGAVTDQSGNARNGTLTGTAAFGTVGIGDGKTAIDLGAGGTVNGYSADAAGAFNGQEGLLAYFAAMANNASWTNGSGYYLHGLGVDANNRTFLRTNADGTLAAYFNAGVASKLVNISAQAGIRWIHYAFAWDLVSGKISLYVNGAKQLQTSGIGTWVGTPVANFMQYGGNQGGGAQFPGRIAHMVLANDPSTDAKIKQLARRKRGVIAFEGDSRTALKPWPFAAVETATPAGLLGYGGYGVASYAVSGSAWGTATPGLDIDGATRIGLVNGLLLGGGNNILVVWGGVNDGSLLTGQQIYDAIHAYCDAQRAAGWNKIVVCSEIDAQANMNWHNTVWPALNALLNADHHFADAYADLGAAPELQDATNLTYYNSDKIHLTAAGYGVVQGIVATALATVTGG